MHEMSLAEGVLQIMEEYAIAEKFRRVRRVVLEIGKLSAVEPVAMRFCFDAVMQGSIAEGAALDIVETEGRGWCAQCACHVPLKALYDACPHCGNFPLGLTEGDAMRVIELEVE